MQLMWIFAIVSTALLGLTTSDDPPCQTEWFSKEHTVYKFATTCSNISSLLTIREYIENHCLPKSFLYESSLRILNSTIPTLRTKNFSDTIAWSRLYLTQIHLESISAHAFHDLKNLKALHLDNNELTELAAHVFTGLGGLEKLFLQHNKIASIDPNVFEGLGSLAQLNLSHNSIEELEMGTFSDLASLEVVDVSYNRLVELNVYVFVTISKVQELYFNDNPHLKAVDVVEMMQHLPQLKMISLRNNNWLLWPCRLLREIFRQCKLNNVAISKGNSVGEGNVNGIACNEFILYFENDKTSSVTVLSKFLSSYHCTTSESEIE